MPMHDWRRVHASVFHAFQQFWVSELARTLNRRLPPSVHYALVERQEPTDEYGRNAVVVRHVSGDRIVAMIEIVSPGNKNNEKAFKAFVEKACELLEYKIHLLLIDPFPPGKRDPNGIHAAIWSMVVDDPFALPPVRPLTLVAYECGMETEAYIETIAVGEPLPDMPLFLEPESYIMAPLEKTYQAAWETVPARWRRVIDDEKQSAQ